MATEKIINIELDDQFETAIEDAEGKVYCYWYSTGV